MKNPKEKTRNPGQSTASQAKMKKEAQSTPTSHSFRTTASDIHRFNEAAHDARDKWMELGMAQFLNLLPKASKRRPRFKPKPFQDAANRTTKREMYESLKNALRPFAPHFEIVLTADCREPPFGSPSIGFYQPGAIGNGECPTQFAKMDSWIQVKPSPGRAPYPTDSTEEEPMETCGQIATYATNTLGTQFRTHLFSIYLDPKQCILYRWDRGKTYQSPPFDYKKQPHLVEFMWRFSHATPTQRGDDESAKPVPCGSEEYHSAYDALKTVIDDIPPQAPLTKLRVDNKVDGVVHPQYFIVHRHLQFPHLPEAHGRATRAYIAYDCQTQHIVLLKDIWRVTKYERENETYAKLREKGVPNIPEIIAAGDIGEGEIYVSCSKEGREFIHYRIVFATIGRPLSSFESIYELIRAIREAFFAHQMAHDADVLHRDISPGNILITDGGGLLIDWEMAKLLAQSVVEPKVKERTGTYQFLSARMVGNSPHVHNAGDDIESFFHVLVWIVIRYGPTDLSSQKRKDFLRAYDAEGAQAKLGVLCSGSARITDLNITYPPLDRLLQQIADIFATRYSELFKRLAILESWYHDDYHDDYHERHDYILALLDEWLREHENSQDTIKAVRHPLEERTEKNPNNPPDTPPNSQPGPAPKPNNPKPRQRTSQRLIEKAKGISNARSRARTTTTHAKPRASRLPSQISFSSNLPSSSHLDGLPNSQAPYSRPRASGSRPSSLRTIPATCSLRSSGHDRTSSNEELASAGPSTVSTAPPPIGLISSSTKRTNPVLSDGHRAPKRRRLSGR